MKNSNPYGSEVPEIPDISESTRHRNDPREPQSCFAAAITIIAIGFVVLTAIGVLLVVAAMLMDMIVGNLR